MNSGLQKRLYEMEVAPPASVWEKLSANIDEINADNLVGKKVLNAELHPPASAWENINVAINTGEKKEPAKIGFTVHFKRLAAAAIFIGVIITAWILFRNNTAPDELVGVEDGVEKTTTAPNGAENIKDSNFTDSPVDRATLKKQDMPAVSANKTFVSNQRRPKRNNFSRRKNDLTAQRTTAQYASLNEPLGNSFNQSIDDLSLVTSDQNYLTMVNANGRLVKIPAQFANLAHHLQNKPVSEDYYEVMFGEGTYWHETLNEWRRKVASLPVSSGDAFTSFIELLKTVQDK